MQSGPTPGSCFSALQNRFRVYVQEIVLYFVQERSPWPSLFCCKAMLKKLLVWHCRPGGSQCGSVDHIFFFYQKISASNPFEMQAKLYAELNDDIFRY